MHGPPQDAPHCHVQRQRIGTRLPQLLDWLHRESPDVVALQELKATDAAFPAAALEEAGYGALWQGEARWNGVALLARGPPG